MYASSLEFAYLHDLCCVSCFMHLHLKRKLRLGECVLSSFAVKKKH